MKPQALAKLELLAASKEASLLDALSRHTLNLQRYAAQRDVLAGYQTRLAAGWQTGDVVQAAEAQRAGHFTTQAQNASGQLAETIAVEEAKRNACAAALAELRAHRQALQERLKASLRQEAIEAQSRAERNRQHIKITETLS